MRVVAAGLPVEIHAAVKAVPVAPVVVPPPKAFLAGRGFQQRPVHREMLGRQQARVAGNRQDLAQEGGGDVDRSAAGRDSS